MKKIIPNVQVLNSKENVSLKDLNILSELIFSENKEYLMYFTPFTNKKNFIDSILRSTKDMYFIIKVDQSIVGYISLRGLDDGYPNPRFGIFISKEFSNKGIGNFASKKIIKLCKDKFDYQFIDLKVDPNNKSAINLYHALGFKLKEKSEPENLMILELN